MDRRNLWTGAVGVVLGVAVISWSSQLEAVPAAFPRVVAVILILLSVATLGKQVVVLIRDSDAREQFKQSMVQIQWRRELRIVVPLVAAISYARFFRVLGFISLTPVLIIGLAMYLGYRKIWIAVAVGFGATALIYVVFRLLLGIPLPRTPYIGI